MDLATYLKEHNLSQAEFGQRFDPPVTQGAVSSWLQVGVRSADRCWEIEWVTRGAVTRLELNPRLFGAIEFPEEPVEKSAA